MLVPSFHSYPSTVLIQRGDDEQSYSVTRIKTAKGGDEPDISDSKLIYDALKVRGLHLGLDVVFNHDTNSVLIQNMFDGEMWGIDPARPLSAIETCVSWTSYSRELLTTQGLSNDQKARVEDVLHEAISHYCLESGISNYYGTQDAGAFLWEVVD